MKAIATGAKKWEGVKWFQELSDKRAHYKHYVATLMNNKFLGKSTKTHMYWSMKNCGNDPKKLRASIMNIVQHYRVIIIMFCSS